jgi:hypothetical protein
MRHGIPWLIILLLICAPTNVLSQIKSEVVQEEYLHVFIDSNSKRVKECRNQWSNERSLQIKYRAQLSYVKSGNRRAALSIDREIVGLKQDIEKNKEGILLLESEMKKTRLDMVKYYKGKPPKKLLSQWERIENQYKEIYEKCVQDVHKVQVAPIE